MSASLAFELPEAVDLDEVLPPLISVSAVAASLHRSARVRPLVALGLLLVPMSLAASASSSSLHYSARAAACASPPGGVT